MKFYGNGVVWDKENNKRLCKFINGEFDAEDERVIAILKSLGYQYDDYELTKKQIMAILDSRNIEYNVRDKKEALLSLLEGVE